MNLGNDKGWEKCSRRKEREKKDEEMNGFVKR